MGAKDPGTNILKSLGLGTVPAAIHGGRVLTESTPLASYVDDLFPNKPLKPSDPVMKFNMNCFLERHSSISGKFDAFLKNQDKEKDSALADKLDEVLNIINDDLAKFDGPFLCGQQFTLADINIFGFVERVMVVLPYWKSWSIPESMNRIFEWYDVVKQRPAVKLTMADRSDESMATYCFQAKVRAECIQESHESYARSESSLTR
jgi:glutathione S-transferase